MALATCCVLSPTPNEIKKLKLQTYTAPQPCFIHFVDVAQLP
jgi:hypothetical protein